MPACDRRTDRQTSRHGLVRATHTRPAVKTSPACSICEKKPWVSRPKVRRAERGRGDVLAEGSSELESPFGREFGDRAL